MTDLFSMSDDLYYALLRGSESACQLHGCWVGQCAAEHEREPAPEPVGGRS